MEKSRKEELLSLSSEIKKDIVRMVGVAHSGPLEMPLAISELLVYLYWEELLVVADDPSREDRDRVLIGIADGVPALYAALARRGYFEREELWHYRRLGAMLQALPDFRRVPGVDAPCITASSELHVAAALAESLKESTMEARVFCLLDAHTSGTPDFILEVKRAAEKKLGSLIVLFILSGQENAAALFTEYGWSVFSADGHSFEELEEVFARMPHNDGLPKAVLVDIKNGRGISFVEAEQSKPVGPLSVEDMDQALEELEGNQ